MRNLSDDVDDDAHAILPLVIDVLQISLGVAGAVWSVISALLQVPAFAHGLLSVLVAVGLVSRGTILNADILVQTVLFGAFPVLSAAIALMIALGLVGATLRWLRDRRAGPLLVLLAVGATVAARLTSILFAGGLAVAAGLARTHHPGLADDVLIVVSTVFAAYSFLAMFAFSPVFAPLLPALAFIGVYGTPSPTPAAIARRAAIAFAAVMAWTGAVAVEGAGLAVFVHGARNKELGGFLFAEAEILASAAVPVAVWTLVAVAIWRRNRRAEPDGT